LFWYYGLKITVEGKRMGKKNTAAPDYTPLANASKDAALIMKGLGDDQLAFSKKMYDENAPLMKDIASKQGAAMDQQLEQGKDYYDYAKDTYRPVEKGIVADALSFDTDAYRNALATKAAADSGVAFNRTRQANERAMASMGVNPNSARFQGIGSQAALMQSANRAGAMTGARERAQQTGYARKLDAAGLGRNLSGASTAAYGSAVGAGNSAGSNYQSAGLNRMAGMGQGAGTIGSGLNMQLSGLGNVLNSQTQMAVAGSQDSFLGDVGGIMGGAAAMSKAGMFSDIRLKSNIKEVGKDDRTGLTLYEFNYKWDNAHKFIGVMAHEVIKKFPEAVSNLGGMFDGYMGVNYQMLGLEMKEVH
jgi:hypothetical protein